MLYGFFGRVSSAPQMKEMLDASAARRDAIAQRVSTATLGGASGFALPGGAAPAPAPVDIEQEMTALADEQIRYETTAKLLERTYSRLRLSIRER